MQDSTITEQVRQFYDEYHQHRVRVADFWMQTVYWPALQGRTLEVGAGTLFPQRECYTLVDISCEAAARATAHSISALVADGMNLPFFDGAFDTVACYDVLEHCADASVFLVELCRVSASRVVVAGPNWVGPHQGGLDRHLPLRLWSFLTGSGKSCFIREDPYLTFDDNWFPDRDALCAPNAGWVAGQLKAFGFRTRCLRSWEWGYRWLNYLPGVRCLGPFMFVMGERG